MMNTGMKYLNDRQLADRFGIEKGTVWRWARSDPSFPKPVKLSPQTVRWRSDEIEAWENSRAERRAG